MRSRCIQVRVRVARAPERMFGEGASDRLLCLRRMTSAGSMHTTHIMRWTATAAPRALTISHGSTRQVPSAFGPPQGAGAARSRMRGGAAVCAGADNRAMYWNDADVMYGHSDDEDYM